MSDPAAPRPSGTEPAGWYRDPACRYLWRWWDGATWTDLTGDGQVGFTDRLTTADNHAGPAAPPSSCPTAGWYTDPACRYAWRWWDGLAWTDTTGDGTNEHTDPLTAADNQTNPSDPPDCPAEPEPTAESTPKPETTVTTEPEPTVAAAGWYPDPTCRHPWRWWDNGWSSSVGDGGEPTNDMVRPGENLPPPGEPFDCPPPGSGLSAAELGCTGDNPPCRFGTDGLVYATRIVSHEELVASGGFRRGLNPNAPDVDDAVALTYLTGCLRSWDDFVPSLSRSYQFTATPAQACSAVWKETSYAVNHLGATDVNCVWGSFARLWLAGGRAYLPSAQSGWAERCSSWLDPQPERDIPAWCADLDISGYLSDISRSPSWEEWGLAQFYFDENGVVDYEWGKTTYCTWMEKCRDLVGAIAPGSNIGQRHNTCDQRIAPQIIFIARRGRCGGLRMLADIALFWARGEELPHVAERPSDQLVAC